MLLCGFWVIALCAQPETVFAGDEVVAALPAKSAAPWRELSVGIIAAPKSWVAYSSSTFSPFDAASADGLRLRVGSGYGRYSYETLPPAQDNCRYGSGRKASINGRVTFMDVLAGYQLSYGAFTTKAFAGWATDTQSLSPRDTCNANSGRDAGLKGVVETWFDVSPRLWLSVDGNWTQAHGAYGLQARVGYRLWPHISIGLEEGVLGNVAGQQRRTGVFARYNADGWELSLSGGLGGQDFDFRQVSINQTWGALNILLRY